MARWRATIAFVTSDQVKVSAGEVVTDTAAGAAVGEKVWTGLNSTTLPAG